MSAGWTTCGVVVLPGIDDDDGDDDESDEKGDDAVGDSKTAASSARRDDDYADDLWLWLRGTDGVPFGPYGLASSLRRLRAARTRT